MKRALIFHGTHGSPQGNWFPWLQDHLMMAGWQVAVPKLPTPEGQSLEGWKTALDEQIPGFADVDIIIGHSSGGTFTLRLLEQGLVKPEQTILVSALMDKINNEEYDTLNESFINTAFNWDSIRDSGSNITLFHGDNDPYVPLSQAEEIAENLDAPLDIIKDGGHINADTGYDQFPEILDVLNV